ncbi:hypothetical protein [Bacillus sp. UNC438CL73TsuS30]|uniref:hypothetical protein n=1 Tax=Bacillus sp. UNC438CL73TsuS30 TaxID=1340434 RepID=UPI00054F6F39|nr:hypothetical protein [Bacillus sp. UNC438CL73TsuS30]
MKKIAMSIFSAALILGAGTAVFAAGNSNSGNGLNFEEMLPFMEKMHPNLTKEKMKDMYKACHVKGGMMENTNSKKMMDRF